MSGEIEATARGHLAADVEVVYVNGQEVGRFRLAVGVRRRDANGEWQSVRTDWLDVSCWGNLVGRISQLRKGAHVEVRGRLAPGAYLDKNGTAQPSTRITASSVTLVPAAVRAA
jgi:single stranded DNA-binding protein